MTHSTPVGARGTIDDNWLEYRYWMGAVPFLIVSAAIGARTIIMRATRFFAAQPEGSATFSESRAES